MKACLAWLCVLIPLISSLALPEPNPASVIPVVVTDLEHTKRDAAPPGKRTVHGVYFCKSFYLLAQLLAGSRR